MKTPAQQIVAARKRAKLSQSEAARLLKMPRQNLNRWECGRAMPRADSLIRVLVLLARAAR